MKARVIKSTGSWYLIHNESGEMLKARIRGKFRMDKIQHTNPITVGDWVEFEVDKDGLAVITKIEKRKNYIIRRSVNLSKRTHIIASNIDRAFLIATVDNPKTSTGFIDRFLITAEAYHIPVTILINKIDACNEDSLREAEAYRKLYEKIGYQVIKISAISGYNFDKLRKELKGIVSLFSGHSGVGKSTLMNLLNPELKIKTAEVSDFNKKGQHTTTFAEMHSWSFGGYCIDTPGIKEFGLAEMKPEEIQQYFPEIWALKDKCKFDNCMHQNEPNCGIAAAVKLGEIASSRYKSYLEFLSEC